MMTFLLIQFQYDDQSDKLSIHSITNQKQYNKIHKTSYEMIYNHQTLLMQSTRL